MKRRKLGLPRFGLGVAAMFAFASPLQAFQRVEFTQAVDLEKVEIDAAGQRSISFAPPRTLLPGDRVRYRLQFENKADEETTHLSFVNPIPPELRFVGTDDVDGFAVSVDGGESFGRLAQLTLGAPGGASRAATAADVTHVQWTLAEPLPAGAVKSVTFFGAVL